MRQLKSKVARYQMDSPSGPWLAMHSGTSPTLFLSPLLFKGKNSHPGVYYWGSGLLLPSETWLLFSSPLIKHLSTSLVCKMLPQGRMSCCALERLPARTAITNKIRACGSREKLVLPACTWNTSIHTDMSWCSLARMVCGQVEQVQFLLHCLFMGLWAVGLSTWASVCAFLTRR